MTTRNYRKKLILFFILDNSSHNLQWLGREGSQGPPQAVSKLASSLQELGLHRQHFPPYTGMVMLLLDTNCR